MIEVSIYSKPAFLGFAGAYTATEGWKWSIVY